jgi:hypothetical protein
MRHKYVITRSQGSEELTLHELSELDKDVFSLVCEEKFPESAIASAAGQGVEALISELRTTNFYPCWLFATKIAESIPRLFAPENAMSVEVYCDDADYLSKKRVVADVIEEIEEDAGDVDELLEDDFDADFDDDIKTPGIETSVDDLLEDDFDGEFDDDLDGKRDDYDIGSDAGDDPDLIE